MHALRGPVNGGAEKTAKAKEIDRNKKAPTVRQCRTAGLNIDHNGN